MAFGFSRQALRAWREARPFRAATLVLVGLDVHVSSPLCGYNVPPYGEPTSGSPSPGGGASLGLEFRSLCLIITTILFALFVAGGGTMPGVLPFVTLALLLALAARKGNGAFTGRARPVFLLSTALILACLCTLIPLPDSLVGAKRASYFTRSRAVLNSLSDLGVDMLAADDSTVADITFLRLLGQRISALGSTRLEEIVPPPVAQGGPAEVRRRPVRSRLTLNRAGTVRGFFLLCSVWACFWYVAGSSVAARARLLVILVFGGALVIATGILGALVIPQGKTLLWAIPVPHGQPMGPFVNRNHYALLCGMLLPASLMLATSGLNEKRRLSVGSLMLGTAGRLGSLLCAVLFAGGVVVSLSRSGILVLVAGIAFLAALTLRNRFVWGVVLVLLAAGLLAGIRYCPLEDFQERMDTLKDPLETASAQTRLNVWGDALRVWRDFPVAGCGMDAFRVVFPTRKTSLSRKGALHAENEYVQIPADHGILGAGLAGALVAAYLWTVLVRRAAPGSGECTDHPDNDSVRAQGLRTVALAVIAAAGVHAFFDFGLRMPLNALVLTCIAACAMPVRGSCSARETNPVQESMRPGFPWLRWTTIILLVIVLPMSNAFWFAAWNMDNPRVLAQSELPTLGKAIAWSPTYWQPWHEIGRRCRAVAAAMHNRRDPRAPLYAQLGNYCTWTAAHLNASDYRIWMVTAEIAYESGEVERAAAAAQRVVLLRPYLRSRMKKYLRED